MNPIDHFRGAQFYFVATEWDFMPAGEIGPPTGMKGHCLYDKDKAIALAKSLATQLRDEIEVFEVRSIGQTTLTEVVFKEFKP